MEVRGFDGSPTLDIIIVIIMVMMVIINRMVMVVMINSMVIMVMMNRMVMMDMINRTVMMVTPINEVKPGVRLLKPFGPGLCRLTGVARDGGEPALPIL